MRTGTGKQSRGEPWKHYPRSSPCSKTRYVGSSVKPASIGPHWPSPDLKMTTFCYTDWLFLSCTHGSPHQYQAFLCSSRKQHWIIAAVEVCAGHRSIGPLSISKVWLIRNGEIYDLPRVIGCSPRIRLKVEVKALISGEKTIWWLYDSILSCILSPFVFEPDNIWKRKALCRVQITE